MATRPGTILGVKGGQVEVTIRVLVDSERDTRGMVVEAAIWGMRGGSTTSSLAKP